MTIDDDGQTLELTVPDLLGARVLDGAADLLDQRIPCVTREMQRCASLMTDHRRARL